MTRSQRRKLAIVIILILLLALLGGYYAYYRATHKLGFDIQPVSSEVVEAPQYLYQFSQIGAERMQRPVGVLVDAPDVFVVDAGLHRIGVFNESGQFKRSFGDKQMLVPLYIAKNPKNGNLYVSDRRSRSIHMFATSGKYLGDFNPKLPKDQLPEFDTHGVQWAPVAIAFGPDGTMYVTEILKGHRLLIFDPAGKFVRSIGEAGIAQDTKQGAKFFQFPNGLVVNKGLVYVTDSNNRRIQIFDAKGEFKRIVETQGLPRGIAFLGKFPGDEAKTPGRYVVIDTLAHDGTIWSTADKKIVSFGEHGILEGQFNYPDATSVGFKNKIFITDTSNGRVQVWGWPNQVSPVPVPRVPRRWWLCLTPLIFLPLLLLLRRKKFFATEDFIDMMLANEQVDLMPARRRMWLVTEQVYESYEKVEQNGVSLGELLHATEHSDSDAREIEAKFEIEYERAAILAIAKRVHVFVTEDADLRRNAKLLEIDVINRAEFLERYASAQSEDSQGASSE